MTFEEEERRHCADVADRLLDTLDDLCPFVGEPTDDCFGPVTELLIRERAAVRAENNAALALAFEKGHRAGERAAGASAREVLEQYGLRTAQRESDARDVATENYAALQAENERLQDSAAAGWAIAKARLTALEQLKDAEPAIRDALKGEP